MINVTVDDVRHSLNDPPEEVVSDETIRQNIQKWSGIVEDEADDGAADQNKNIAIREAAACDSFQNIKSQKSIRQFNTQLDYAEVKASLRESAGRACSFVGVSYDRDGSSNSITEVYTTDMIGD